jgi:hypothetical protein
MSLIACSSFAVTEEVSASVNMEEPNFWQEFDITFWQTLPFATLMGYFVDRQLSNIMFPGAEVHWNVVLTFAGVVSAGNAYINAHREIRGD